MILARIVLPPLVLESFTLIGLLLATIGALFLVIAFALQALQPGIDILNQIK